MCLHCLTSMAQTLCRPQLQHPTSHPDLLGRGVDRHQDLRCVKSDAQKAWNTKRLKLKKQKRNEAPLQGPTWTASGGDMTCVCLCPNKERCHTGIFFYYPSVYDLHWNHYYSEVIHIQNNLFFYCRFHLQVCSSMTQKPCQHSTQKPSKHSNLVWSVGMQNACRSLRHRFAKKIWTGSKSCI